MREGSYFSLPLYVVVANQGSFRSWIIKRFIVSTVFQLCCLVGKTADRTFAVTVWLLCFVKQKRKLSDKPVEAGEDYTKFNSADFTRKVSENMHKMSFYLFALLKPAYSNGLSVCPFIWCGFSLFVPPLLLTTNCV